MKLHKAIETLQELLQEILDDEESQWEPDGQNALKLGREALESIKISRTRPVPYNIALLPSETEE